MDQETVIKANELYDDGALSELYEFIKPFLDAGDPYALYFSSRFSLAEWNESDEEYDKRYVNSLTRAAEENIPEAMYRLSSLYLTGDIVEMNLDVGKSYLNKAVDLNFGLAKYSVGINLYYGSNGYPKNIEKSIEILSDAASDNVEGASEALDKIKNTI